MENSNSTIVKKLKDSTLNDTILNAKSLSNIVENDELSEILTNYAALSDLAGFITWSDLSNITTDKGELVNEIDPIFTAWFNANASKINTSLNINLNDYVKKQELIDLETDPQFTRLSGSFQQTTEMDNFISKSEVKNLFNFYGITNSTAESEISFEKIVKFIKALRNLVE